ncbi:MAG TPA: hypothetical protein VMC41_04455 [Candidatus Nanoarchaeia archaeon]|nr:hypothetical protein [Candidatus Nanoarchaeia archaeon]
MRIKILIQELFYFLTASLLVFFAMEEIWPRIVLSYFNLNYLLLAWLAIGIILLKINKGK